MALTNFQQRAITGFFFVLILVCAIIYSSLSLGILFFVISILGLNEFYELAIHANVKVNKKLSLPLGAILFLSIVLSTYLIIPIWSVFVVFSLLFILFIAELYSHSEKPFQNIAFSILGMMYVIIPFSFAVSMCGPLFTQSSYTYAYILGYFLLLWTSDTGAYLSGRAFGKTKLFERISPKKTWEGTIGGMLLAFGVAYILSLYFKQLHYVHWFVIAFIVTVVGSFGDLVESMFKRSINIKDSGNILPGHGGILDRFYGLLISMPFVAVYLYIMHHI